MKFYNVYSVCCNSEEHVEIWDLLDCKNVADQKIFPEFICLKITHKPSSDQNWASQTIFTVDQLQIYTKGDMLLVNTPVAVET